MLNLSLLTSDMWAVLIRIFAYHQKVDWMYFVAFAIVVVGLVIYSWGDKDEEQRLADVTHEDAERSKRFDEEVGSVTRNRGTMAGTSKAGGDNSKDEAPTSSTELWVPYQESEAFLTNFENHEHFASRDDERGPPTPLSPSGGFSVTGTTNRTVSTSPTHPSVSPIGDRRRRNDGESFWPQIRLLLGLVSEKDFIRN
ncbi:hypothetical protein ACLB2K_050455 [Fragaria x ananassa]